MVILSSESKSTGLHFSISISASKKKNNPCQHQHIGSVFVLLKCKGSTGAILLQTNSSISMNMQLARRLCYIGGTALSQQGDVDSVWDLSLNYNDDTDIDL